MKIPLFALFVVCCIAAWAFVFLAAKAMFTGQFHVAAGIVLVTILTWCFHELKNPTQQ